MKLPLIYFLYSDHRLVSVWRRKKNRLKWKTRHTKKNITELLLLLTLCLQFLGCLGFFFLREKKKTAAWHQVWKSLLPNSILTFNSCSPSVCIWLLDTNKTKDASAGWRRFGYNNEFHLCFHLSPSARFTATGWWNTAATSVWMDVIVSLD